VVLAGALFARDWVDVALIIVVTALVLVAEIMNSAIEALCDFVAMLAWLLVLGFEAGEMLRKLP
jgi:diacylglycerol kinase